MDDDEGSAHWLADEVALAEIGEALRHQPRTIAVRIPTSLADKARASWNRERADESPSPAADRAEQVRRGRAAHLALIGRVIQEGGDNDGEEVAVELDVFLLASALQAAAELKARRFVRGDGR